MSDGRHRDIIPKPKDALNRVLVLGMCPLPTKNEFQTLGPGKRTWQFVKALLDQDSHVCLITSRHPAAYADQQKQPVEATQAGSLIHYSVEQRVFDSVRWVQGIHDHFQPDCIVGATVYPSSVACRLNTDKPIWADLFGHTMAEAQTKCQVFDDDFYFYHYWRDERRVLDHAAAFSVVSHPQLCATIGELGTRGRLNRFTVGYPFVHVIPCAVPTGAVTEPREHKVLRGREVGIEDFVILWSGGYNTWTDVKTLFGALETAMARDERIKFVSTGGEIGGHDELTYPAFIQMIEGSRFRNRFIMKGWIPLNLVPQYWREANIGINVDKLTYEALLGSRNRILDWMGVGLPVLTSRVCELTEIMEIEKLGLTFTPENPRELTDLILAASHQPEKLRAMAERAQAYSLRQFSIDATTKPLVKWVQLPSLAPDFGRTAKLHADQREPLSVVYGHYLASLRNQWRTQGLKPAVLWAIRRLLQGVR